MNCGKAYTAETFLKRLYPDTNQCDTDNTESQTSGGSKAVEHESGGLKTKSKIDPLLDLLSDYLEDL